MKIAIVSFGYADTIVHYAKTISSLHVVDLIFVYALNKRVDSILNFENEKINTGFLDDKQVDGILGNTIKRFINGTYKVKVFINHNLKIRSFRNLVLSARLAGILDNYDIIHFNGLDATILPINYFLRNKKRVFTIHDIKLHSGEKGRKFFNIAESICRWIIKSKYPVIVQNKFDYNEIIEQYPGKKEKIYFIPFKNLNIFKQFLSDNSPAVKSDLLFFGRISPYKGLNYLVDAVKIVKKVFPGVKVIIAGSGNIEKKTMDKLNDNFIVRNRYISNEELAGLITYTKMVVCPYTDATQSGVVMTSFAFGKPVIATTVGGFTDVIKNGVTGFLVPPRNSEKLAGAIINMLSDENMISDMSKNISAECIDGAYSWDSILTDASIIYK
jgi:glycosyltransferase involved in cell wall biosynthesis